MSIENVKKQGTVTAVLEEYIEQAEKGNTITADALKSFSKHMLNCIKKYKEQNQRGIAFEVMAKQFLSKEEFDKIDDYANQLLKLEEEDAKKNGIRR